MRPPVQRVPGYVTNKLRALWEFLVGTVRQPDGQPESGEHLHWDRDEGNWR